MSGWLPAAVNWQDVFILNSRHWLLLFAEEQTMLMPVNAIFDAIVEETKRASHLCLIHIDRNRYSVPAHWANTVVSVRLTADCVRIVAEAQMIAEHARCFGRDQLSCDPWHYLPILEKKPGVIRHGAPLNRSHQA